MKVCKKCKKQVPNKLKICKYCGSDVSKARIIPSNNQNKNKATKQNQSSNKTIESKTKNKTEINQKVIKNNTSNEITKTITKVELNKKENLETSNIKIDKKDKLNKKDKINKETVKEQSKNKNTKKLNNIIKKIKNIKNKKYLKLAIIITIIICLAITATILGTKAHNKLFDTGIEVKPNEETKVFKENDTIRYKDVTYKIKKIRTNEEGTKYRKPQKDNQFIIVTLEYENMSKNPIKYSAKNWKLENQDKKESQRLFTALDVDTALYSGKLVIGATKTGTIVFEQPKKYDTFKLNYYELKEEPKKEQSLKTDKKDESKKEENKQQPIFSINVKLNKKEELTKK